MGGLAPLWGSPTEATSPSNPPAERHTSTARMKRPSRPSVYTISDDVLTQHKTEKNPSYSGHLMWKRYFCETYRTSLALHPWTSGESGVQHSVWLYAHRLDNMEALLHVEPAALIPQTRRVWQTGRGSAGRRSHWKTDGETVSRGQRGDGNLSFWWWWADVSGDQKDGEEKGKNDRGKTRRGSRGGKTFWTLKGRKGMNRKVKLRCLTAQHLEGMLLCTVKK